MRREQLLEFMRSHRYAVEASVSPSGGALAGTRKARNLRRNATIAFVIGGTVSDFSHDPPEIVELDAQQLLGDGNVRP
jgi:hypothetical protein